MIRIHPRVIDRLLNAGIAVRRYRCHAPICAHEYLSKPDTLDAAARPWLVTASLTAIAIVSGLFLISEMEGMQEGLERGPSFVSQSAVEPAEALPASIQWSIFDANGPFQVEGATASARRR
jgi:hypothetical protein